MSAATGVCQRDQMQRAASNLIERQHSRVHRFGEHVEIDMRRHRSFVQLIRLDARRVWIHRGVTAIHSTVQNPTVTAMMWRVLARGHVSSD